MAHQFRLCSYCLSKFKEVSAISHCRTCDDDLCDKHVELHVNTHDLNPIDGVQQQPVRAMCADHESEAIKGFCDKCNKTICGACLFNAHKGHPVRSLEEVKEEKIVVLKGKQVDVLKLLARLQSGIANHKKSATDNVNSCTIALAHLDKQCRAHEAAIAVARAKMVLLLKTASDEKGKPALDGPMLQLEFSECNAENVLGDINTRHWKARTLPPC